MSQTATRPTVSAVTSPSILFVNGENEMPRLTLVAPACFADLNLDQIVEAITAGREEYDLKPFFYTPLTTVDALQYRHEVLRDLESDELLGSVGRFAHLMREIRKYALQADKLRVAHQKERWILDAVQLYDRAVRSLAEDLDAANVQSRGLSEFRDYLVAYLQSSSYVSMVEEAARLIRELSAIRYCVQIRGNRVQVTPYESEIDYGAEVESTFEKFKQGGVAGHLVAFPNWVEMNHVEADILSFVASLNPDTFHAVASFCAQHSSYVDRAIASFDREIQFYVAYRAYTDIFVSAGLPVCYPEVVDRSTALSAHAVFDLALATKLIPTRREVVCNDFALVGAERILVVSGANQGGKTTFARAFGQVHYLAALGCTVPGRDAHLTLFDDLLTHFEKEEDLHGLSGKLEDDLLRIRDILDRATERSIVIMNEIFTSTTLDDAVFLAPRS